MELGATLLHPFGCCQRAPKKTGGPGCFISTVAATARATANRVLSSAGGGTPAAGASTEGIGVGICLDDHPGAVALAVLLLLVAAVRRVRGLVVAGALAAAAGAARGRGGGPG